jgi:hypothetical protein
MTARGERWLLVLTPFAAMAAVGIGLRAGASDRIVAATVYSAPASQAGIGLAWQVVAFQVKGGTREPLARQPLEVTARAGDSSAHWTGSTNDDGVAETQLPVAGADTVAIEVRAGDDILAQGDARVPPRLERAAPPIWMPFARRQGPILIDVTVVGQRLLPGFPASIWIRAADATGARLSGVTFEPEADGSLTFSAPSSATTADGWGELTATAVGFAVTLTLRAQAPDGRTGQWQGGLFTSPGAVKIDMLRRFAPDVSPAIHLRAPTPRATAYLEIDDAKGRVWAAAASLVRTRDGTGGADSAAPSLPPGLYWAVASSDAGGATTLGAGTSTLPFFIAASDADALRFGTDPSECVEPARAAQTARALGPCLAVAAAGPVARWTALDGFSEKNRKLRDKRLRGMTIAWGSILVAMALESLLILRAAARGRRRRPSPEGESHEEVLAMSRPLEGVVAVLVALLGFAVIAAFVLRWA